MRKGGAGAPVGRARCGAPDDIGFVAALVRGGQATRRGQIQRV